MLFLEGCTHELFIVVQFIKTIVRYICIIVPIILIVIGTFDLLKAVTASKEDEIKAAQKLLIKRVIYAVLIFLLVPILSLVFGLFGDDKLGKESNYQASWKNYWFGSGICKSEADNYK